MGNCVTVRMVKTAGQSHARAGRKRYPRAAVREASRSLSLPFFSLLPESARHPPLLRPISGSCSTPVASTGRVEHAAVFVVSIGPWSVWHSPIRVWPTIFLYCSCCSSQMSSPENFQFVRKLQLTINLQSDIKMSHIIYRWKPLKRKNPMIYKLAHKSSISGLEQQSQNQADIYMHGTETIPMCYDTNFGFVCTYTEYINSMHRI